MGLPDWDAQAYHRVSEPQFRWGLEVLGRLPLRGDETVLDAGCGSGRLTARLLERLPQGRVIALDSSEKMLAEARLHLAAWADRVSFVHADLGTLQLDRVCDVVFSTATFHWVKDHAALFAGLFRAVKPGGALLAQCGGGDNLRRILTRAHALADRQYREHFVGYVEPTHFTDPETARRHLEAAGFTGVEAALQLAPTPFESRATFEEFTRAVVLKNHLARLSNEDVKRAFLAEMSALAAADAPPLELDYVRLNLRARRPS